MPQLPINRQSLSGEWELRRHDEQSWQPIPVPGCWESSGIFKDDPRPFWYRKTISIPLAFSGKRIWFQFSGVSYACQVWVNGQAVAEHIGMWDAFNVEITRFVQADQPAELLLRLEKPASLTSGPDSRPVPGSFPLRQTLSGFLPYVWGHSFGGIWQDVELYATGQAVLTSFSAFGDPSGHVVVQANIDAPESAKPLRLVLRIADPDGVVLPQETLILRGDLGEWSLNLPHPQTWSPDHPVLYTAHLVVEHPDGSLSDERSLRFGLKSFTSRGFLLLLNEQPLYPRLILSWGWYPNRLDANPGPDQVRRDFISLKEMGYNGVKLCLWFPPAYYFDLADELGMILWVELPLWLPEESTFFREQTAKEMERLVLLARQHSSVLLFTVGCELGKQIDQSYLLSLYDHLKKLTSFPLGIGPQALLCDNSGSGEAYGGWLDQQADFYDHHLYSEPHFLRQLLSFFAPAWRQIKPWLMGEFCDYDTFRPLPALLAQRKPWWTEPDPKLNPQGARWEMRLSDHSHKLRRIGMWDHTEELVAESHRQALIHRKLTLDIVRATPQLSGYVITGERDTPISTAGMWDDFGNLKFDPHEWQSFNQDMVLCLGFDRRRTWKAGGDRPIYTDRFQYKTGDPFRIHLLLSHYGQVAGLAKLHWRLSIPAQPPFASDGVDCHLEPGTLQEVALISLTVPQFDSPQQVILDAWLTVEGKKYSSSPPLAQNTWPFWLYPSDPWAGVLPFSFEDPNGLLSGMEELPRDLIVKGLQPGHAALCTAWTGDVQTFVYNGGRVVLLQQEHGIPGPLPVVPVPFWRESLKLAEPHLAWGNFPYQEPGLQFYALAPDCALDAGSSLSLAGWQPILRRLDARGMDLHEYILEMRLGSGLLIVSTMRLQGGLGDQPSGLRYNVAGQWLLTGWLRYLQQSRSQLKMA